jgi:hypothetical protein
VNQFGRAFAQNMHAEDFSGFGLGRSVSACQFGRQ